MDSGAERADALCGRDGRSTDWDSLCRGLDARESQAIRKVFDIYSARLVRLASRNIHPALARRFDGEDVVQSVFRTFFRRLQNGELRIKQSAELWRLLVTITLRKTRSKARRHTAACRNVAHEERLPDDAEIIDSHVGSDDLFALWEEIDTVLAGLPDRASQIVALRLEGKGHSEIAQELDLTRQTIYRILKLVEERLMERLDEIALSDRTN